MAGDVLGVCGRLVQEGLISESAVANCTRVVDESVLTGNITALGSKVAENASSIGGVSSRISHMSSDIGGNELLNKIISALAYIVKYMLYSLSELLQFFGINFTPTEKSLLASIIAIIILAALFDQFIKMFGRWTINSVVGLVALILLHYLFDVTIPITLFTIVVVAIFGVPGLLALIVLHIGGIV